MIFCLYVVLELIIRNKIGIIQKVTYRAFSNLLNSQIDLLRSQTTLIKGNA